MKIHTYNPASRIIAILAFLCSCNLYAQIPNAGFEAWKSDSFTTLRNWDYPPGLSSKVAGKNGGSALNLRNLDLGFGNEITGYAHLAFPDYDTGIYKPAFAYASLPDSVKITYKAKLSLDTGVVIIGFTHAAEASPIYLAQAFLVHTNDQWVTLTVPVLQQFASTFTPDSAWVVIESSGSSIISANDNVSIDQIIFTDANGTPMADFPNNKFELWDNYTQATPVNWMSSDKLNAFDYPISGTTMKSLSPKNGNYAVTLRSVVAPSNDTLNGFVYTGNSIEYFDPLSIPSFPISTRYNSLRGYVKGNLLSNDLAVSEINVFSNGQIVGNGYLEFSNIGPSYSFFQAEIDYDVNFSGTPDSATIMLSLEGEMQYTVNNINSTVTFDELELSAYNAGNATAHSGDVRIFPNPAKEKLNIHLGSNVQGSAILYNTSGQALLSAHIYQGRQVLDLERIPPGLYYLTIQTQGYLLTKPIQIHAH